MQLQLLVFLTTEAMVAEMPEPKEPMPPMPGAGGNCGMGGMGGMGSGFLTPFVRKHKVKKGRFSALFYLKKNLFILYNFLVLDTY